jgi:hypothetical protein
MQPTQIQPVSEAQATATAEQTLRRAARYLVSFGWCQGHLFDGSHRVTPRASALGAIRMAVLGCPDGTDWWQLPVDEVARITGAESFLAAFLTIEGFVEDPAAAEESKARHVIQEWNDHPDTTVGKVVAALAGTAEICHYLAAEDLADEDLADDATTSVDGAR